MRTERPELTARQNATLEELALELYKASYFIYNKENDIHSLKTGVVDFVLTKMEIINRLTATLIEVTEEHSSFNDRQLVVTSSGIDAIAHKTMVGYEDELIPEEYLLVSHITKDGVHITEVLAKNTLKKKL